MDLKIVVNIKEDRATIGVQAPDTDPVMEALALVDPDRALAEAFEATVDLVARARQRWATSPKDPAYQRPPPPPVPASATPAPRPAAPARAPKPAAKMPQPMF